MRNLIVISQCLGTVRKVPHKKVYAFHFKGVFDGFIIKKIYLTHESKGLGNPVYGQEYYLLVQVMNVENCCLWGNIIKLKNLDDCVDES